MESTLDVLKRIEEKINAELKSTEEQYYKTEEDDYVEHEIIISKRVGLRLALNSVHEEMDKITGSENGGS